MVMIYHDINHRKPGISTTSGFQAQTLVAI